MVLGFGWKRDEEWREKLDQETSFWKKELEKAVGEKNYYLTKYAEEHRQNKVQDAKMQLLEHELHVCRQQLDHLQQQLLQQQQCDDHADLGGSCQGSPIKSPTGAGSVTSVQGSGASCVSPAGTRRMLEIQLSSCQSRLREAELALCKAEDRIAALNRELQAARAEMQCVRTTSDAYQAEAELLRSQLVQVQGLEGDTAQTAAWLAQQLQEVQADAQKLRQDANIKDELLDLLKQQLSEVAPAGSGVPSPGSSSAASSEPTSPRRQQENTSPCPSACLASATQQLTLIDTQTQGNAANTHTGQTSSLPVPASGAEATAEPVPSAFPDKGQQQAQAPPPLVLPPLPPGAAASVSAGASARTTGAESSLGALSPVESPTPGPLGAGDVVLVHHNLAFDDGTDGKDPRRVSSPETPPAVHSEGAATLPPDQTLELQPVRKATAPQGEVDTALQSKGVQSMLQGPGGQEQGNAPVPGTAQARLSVAGEPGRSEAGGGPTHPAKSDKQGDDGAGVAVVAAARAGASATAGEPSSLVKQCIRFHQGTINSHAISTGSSATSSRSVSGAGSQQPTDNTAAVPLSVSPAAGGTAHSQPAVTSTPVTTALARLRAVSSESAPVVPRLNLQQLTKRPAAPPPSNQPTTQAAVTGTATSSTVLIQPAPQAATPPHAAAPLAGRSPPAVCADTLRSSSSFGSRSTPQGGQGGNTENDPAGGERVSDGGSDVDAPGEGDFSVSNIIARFQSTPGVSAPLLPQGKYGPAAAPRPKPMGHPLVRPGPEASVHRVVLTTSASNSPAKSARKSARDTAQ